VVVDIAGRIRYKISHLAVKENDMAKRNDSPVYYVTHWVEVKNGKKKAREYATKSLTPMHEHLRKTFSSGYTVKCDKSVKWPLGVWAEIIFESADQLAKRKVR
jgi:hypothetical protein